MQKSKLLNVLFVLAIVLVTGAIACVCWYSFERLQTRQEAVSSIHVGPEDSKITEGQFERFHYGIDETKLNVSDNPQQVIQSSFFNLSGTEVAFAKALSMFENHNYKEAEFLCLNVLHFIPQEAGEKKKWRASAVLVDKLTYSSMVNKLLAKCYLKQQKYDAAVKALSQAIADKPEIAENYSLRAEAYAKLGKTVESANDLKKTGEGGAK